MARSPTSTQLTNADRAIAAYDAMRQHFFVADGSGLYRETYPWTGGNNYCFLWPFTRASVGTLALAGMPGGTNYMGAVQSHISALANYWDGTSKPSAYDSYVISGGGGDKYYDDNAWVALALIQQYRMGLTSSLQRAEQLFTFALSGWDTNVRDPAAGGVFWVQQRIGTGLANHDRATGPTGGNAEVGLHLCLLTGSDKHQADATMMMNWVSTYLQSRTSLYYNSLNALGVVDTNLWSYNQGVMIGANVLRYELTAEQDCLASAVATAESALGHYGTFHGHPPSYVAMLLQNLLQLYPHAHAALRARIIETMQSYADWAWDNPEARDPDTNVFYFNDPGQPIRASGQPAQLRDQGAMTQIFALLAWSEDDYDNSC